LQSPVDIALEKLVKADVMKLIGTEYAEFAKTSIKDKAISISSGLLSLTHWDGLESNFSPLQMHFHAPSEHTIDGKHFDLEVHLVHKRLEATEPELVLAFIFDLEIGGDVENLLLADLTFSGENTNEEVSVYQLGQFLETVDFQEFFSYTGSLTTPPCTEEILWCVVGQIQPISRE